jgi:hypothetical protein
MLRLWWGRAATAVIKETAKRERVVLNFMAKFEWVPSGWKIVEMK